LLLVVETPMPIQRELRELNREMPLVGISTVRQVLHNSLWASRLGASLRALFGALALIPATVGIYGVMSYAVSRRTQEIGLRMTLGADHHDVMRTVFRQGMPVVGGGLMLGLGAAAAATRLVGSRCSSARRIRSSPSRCRSPWPRSEPLPTSSPRRARRPSTP
jgi:predicted lysophospholipase L1 biosynthesis ABC-type transport system permease subunit